MGALPHMREITRAVLPGLKAELRRRDAAGQLSFVRKLDRVRLAALEIACGLAECNCPLKIHKCRCGRPCECRWRVDPCKCHRRKWFSLPLVVQAEILHLIHGRKYSDRARPAKGCPARDPRLKAVAMLERADDGLSLWHPFDHLSRGLMSIDKADDVDREFLNGTPRAEAVRAEEERLRLRLNAAAQGRGALACMSLIERAAARLKKLHRRIPMAKEEADRALDAYLAGLRKVLGG